MVAWEFASPSFLPSKQEQMEVCHCCQMLSVSCTCAYWHITQMGGNNSQYIILCFTCSVVFCSGSGSCLTTTALNNRTMKTIVMNYEQPCATISFVTYQIVSLLEQGSVLCCVLCTALCTLMLHYYYYSPLPGNARRLGLDSTLFRSRFGYSCLRRPGLALSYIARAMMLTSWHSRGSLSYTYDVTLHQLVGLDH